MDATYWNDHFGVVVAKDNLTGRVLWHKFIYRKEMVEDYIEGVRWLEEVRHAEVLCVVSDGLRGLRDRLSPRLFQHCQFHQIKSVRERREAMVSNFLNSHSPSRTRSESQIRSPFDT